MPLEVFIVKRLNHPGIVKFIDCLEDGEVNEKSQYSFSTSFWSYVEIRRTHLT